jgi:membrane-bound lytic murein transglycosylase B
MANAVITSSIVMKESLFQLRNALKFSKLANRQYDKEFRKVGDTVSVRKPVKFYTADGVTRVNQDVTEGKKAVTLDQRKHVSWNFSTQDLTLSIEEYSKRYITPAMVTLAQTIDAKGASLYQKVWNSVGTPGTIPANYLAVGDGAQRLTEMAVPEENRKGVLTPAAFHKIAQGRAGLVE